MLSWCQVKGAIFIGTESVEPEIVDTELLRRMVGDRWRQGIQHNDEGVVRNKVESREIMKENGCKKGEMVVYSCSVFSHGVSYSASWPWKSVVVLSVDCLALSCVVLPHFRTAWCCKLGHTLCHNLAGAMALKTLCISTTKRVLWRCHGRCLRDEHCVMP